MAHGLAATIPQCTGCGGGPRGERGHVDMRLLMRGGPLVNGRSALARFSCAVCARIWERRALAQGYLWMLRAESTPARPVAIRAVPSPGSGPREDSPSRLPNS